jgi:hypothetical protein
MGVKLGRVGRCKCDFSSLLLRTDWRTCCSNVGDLKTDKVSGPLVPFSLGLNS